MGYIYFIKHGLEKNALEWIEKCVVKVDPKLPEHDVQ